MNRLAMAERIDRRMPIVVDRYEDEAHSAEEIRVEFVADYPFQRIQNLSLDEFVIGKGADNRSFCYRLEREMDALGKIVGSTAFKFGVYYGHTKSDPVDKYRFRRHWGSNVEEAFAAVKKAIADLHQAAARNDFTAVASNTLSPMFKGKILFVYHPDQYAPIYSGEHLQYFIAKLDLNGSFECEADMQRALMDYRATWPQLVARSPALYMRCLYDVFGAPPKQGSTEAREQREPLLPDAIQGADFISEMPSAPPTAREGDARHRTTVDHEKRQRNSKRIGDRGELIVFALEQKRLSEAGKTDLANKVDHVSQRDDRRGYDILSFDEDGSDRPIEVKATSASDMQQGFYITANELDAASELPNYHLYLVFSAMSKRPRVLRLKNPNLKGSGFELDPLVFRVSLAR